MVVTLPGCQSQIAWIFRFRISLSPAEGKRTGAARRHSRETPALAFPRCSQSTRRVMIVGFSDIL
jgi:hypothetical protein